MNVAVGSGDRVHDGVAGSFANDLRSVRVVWHRELVRYRRNPVRIVASLVQPVLFLLVLGTGLARILPEGAGVDFRTFMFPGVLAMAVAVPAFFSAFSMVWDREFGFLREMLAAPVRRSSIIVGKCLGGATIATGQSTVLLALAGLVGVPYDATVMLPAVALIGLTALVFCAIGALVATWMTSMESFQAVSQLLVVPMLFLSGAIFPLEGLPRWLSFLTRIDPLAYAVAPLRRIVFRSVDAPSAVLDAFGADLTWNGWTVPLWAELVVLTVCGATCFVLALRRLSRGG